jgi:hypothetical protein
MRVPPRDSAVSSVLELFVRRQRRWYWIVGSLFDARTQVQSHLVGWRSLRDVDENARGPAAPRRSQEIVENRCCRRQIRERREVIRRKRRHGNRCGQARDPGERRLC